MNVLDIVEAFCESLQAVFKKLGLEYRFKRGARENLNPSCSITVHGSDCELDFLVWESGELELILSYENGENVQIHFDDIRDKEELATMLSRSIDWVVSSIDSGGRLP